MSTSPVVKASEVRGLSAYLRFLENFLFGYRRLVLVMLLVVTVVMGWFAIQLKMDAGFDKQLPINHEYVKTFNEYRNDLRGANRLTIAVKSRDGKIWSKAGLTRLYEVGQAVAFLKHVSRPSVQSLWTPNTFVNEITEEGFRSEPLIPGTIVPERLNDTLVQKIANSASQGGFIGSLVSNDQSSALITVDLIEVNNAGEKIDYSAFDDRLEELRSRFEDDKFEIQIIGFAKQIGDISRGASSVLEFSLIALLLTGLAVFWYCHSLKLTLLTVFCSLASLVWQFGTLHIMGYGLDPLGVLVPFLVFAIGVSHGVQQINYIIREIATGKTVEKAARASFSGLLIPGVLALVTAFVTFITLVLMPIPMVRELAITASLGVAYKIITNLIMLPLAASMLKVPNSFAVISQKRASKRAERLNVLASLAVPRKAFVTVVVATGVLALAVWQSSDRVVGSLQAGAPELRESSRFNQDAMEISTNYNIGLDWLTVIFEADGVSCDNVNVGLYQDKFTWGVQSLPGVLSVVSYSGLLKQYNQGFNEGHPKMSAVPIDQVNYGGLSAEVARVPGMMRKDCSMTAVNIYLSDHKATTINGVIAEIKQFREQYKQPGVKVRLAAGNAGVQAAINEEIRASEAPMLLYVYATIIILVLLTYRDIRAVLACCLPLTIGTFIGYWFMKELQIGLTVATLPVMVLAVGIGVDYAFYIYNRLQLHLASGLQITEAIRNSIQEVGTATIFTAITLAAGVATWSFSPLKFQADMGQLLSFMFIVNMLMAMIVLPAFAVCLERVFPRRSPVRASLLMAH